MVVFLLSLAFPTVGLVPLLSSPPVCAAAGCALSVLFAIIAREASPFVRVATNALLVMAVSHLMIQGWTEARSD